MAGGGWGEAEDLRSSTWPMRRDGKKVFLLILFIFLLFTIAKTLMRKLKTDVDATGHELLLPCP